MSPLRPNVSLWNSEQAPYIIKNMRYLFKLSTSQTCPLCPQVDSALHIVSGCQHTQIRNMITERHNLACRMIFKAISKTGSLGSCVVSMDKGSNERMTMQNLQIPETAESRIVPKWLLPLLPVCTPKKQRTILVTWWESSVRDIRMGPALSGRCGNSKE